MAHATPFEEGDAPAVTVVVGATATLREAGEAEGHVGGRVAVHPEQLAHGADISFALVKAEGRRAGQRDSAAGRRRWPARTVPQGPETPR
jgi:hypothetical protein